MSYEQEQNAQKGHTDWLEDIAETRQLVREALMKLRQGKHPPQRAILASQVQSDAVRVAHSGVLDFRDLVEPWSSKLDRWEKSDLGQCTVYRSSPSAVEALQTGGERRPGGAIDTARPTESGQLIGLDKLSKFENERVTYWQQQARGLGSSMYEPVQEQMFMPPSVASMAFRQLNAAINDLDLAAQAAPPPEPRDEDPQEVNRRVLEQVDKRLDNLGDEEGDDDGD